MRVHANAVRHRGAERSAARLSHAHRLHNQVGIRQTVHRLAHDVVHLVVRVVFLGMRTLTKFLAGEAPGPDAAITKLNWSEYHKQLTELSLDVLGPTAMTPTGEPPKSAFQADAAGTPADNTRSWTDTFLNARAGTIYAGTSQVQRNIIGEMVLGLPKEPRADKGAWKDVRS